MAAKVKPIPPFKETVQNLFMLGVVLLLAGAALMVGAWPETTVYGAGILEEPVISESGSSAWVFIGAIILGIGQILVAIGIIACGVRIGTRDRVATPIG